MTEAQIKALEALYTLAGDKTGQYVEAKDIDKRTLTALLKRRLISESNGKYAVTDYGYQKAWKSRYTLPAMPPKGEFEYPSKELEYPDKEL